MLVLAFVSRHLQTQPWVVSHCVLCVGFTFQGLIAVALSEPSCPGPGLILITSLPRVNSVRAAACTAQQQPLTQKPPLCGSCVAKPTNKC